MIEGLFRDAGFANSEIHTVPAPHRMASAAEYVQVAREAFGGFNARMAGLTPVECKYVWDEIENTMRCLESADGFEAPGKCLVAAATK